MLWLRQGAGGSSHGGYCCRLRGHWGAVPHPSPVLLHFPGPRGKRISPAPSFSWKQGAFPGGSACLPHHAASPAGTHPAASLSPSSCPAPYPTHSQGFSAMNLSAAGLRIKLIPTGDKQAEAAAESILSFPLSFPEPLCGGRFLSGELPSFPNFLPGFWPHVLMEERGRGAGFSAASLCSPAWSHPGIWRGLGSGWAGRAEQGCGVSWGLKCGCCRKGGTGGPSRWRDEHPGVQSQAGSCCTSGISPVPPGKLRLLAALCMVVLG